MIQAKNFEHLIGTKGFSDILLRNHFTLYNGYIINTEKLINIFSEKEKGSVEFSELKRRFGWEFNGMRLHELYFENMTKDSAPLSRISRLFKKIEDDFSGFEEFEKELKALALMRGIGWVVLYYDPFLRKLFLTWINEHDTGHLAACFPLLVLDVFEHAYMIDYGVKKADYIEHFLKVINWQAVEERFMKSLV